MNILERHHNILLCHPKHCVHCVFWTRCGQQKKTTIDATRLILVYQLPHIFLGREFLQARLFQHITAHIFIPNMCRRTRNIFARLVFSSAISVVPDGQKHLVCVPTHMFCMAATCLKHIWSQLKYEKKRQSGDNHAVRCAGQGQPWQLGAFIETDAIQWMSGMLSFDKWANFCVNAKLIWCKSFIIGQI